MMITPAKNPLAPLVWAENEVKEGQVTSRHFPTNHNENSKLPPCFAQEVSPIFWK